MSRTRVVYETRSRMSGRISVVEVRGERRLVVGGAILSAYPCNGDWTRIRREYWWHALAALPLRRRPSVLFVGLGGGTQLHLLRQRAAPRSITAVERDPTIVRIAHRWFGLAGIPRLEFLCADAESAIPTLVRARRRFDFVMEDATYADTAARSIPLARALARLVAPGGTLVINRHRRPHARATVAALQPLFQHVRVRRVRREADNVLVCCALPMRRARADVAARRAS